MIRLKTPEMGSFFLKCYYCVRSDVFCVLKRLYMCLNDYFFSSLAVFLILRPEYL
jgi:hypothetical protein